MYPDLRYGRVEAATREYEPTIPVSLRRSERVWKEDNCMATVALSATPRAGKGTGIARKLRQGGEVPAVIYGHSRNPQSPTLNTRQIDKLLTQIAGTTTVVELTVGGNTVKTLIREVQRHPVKRNVIHVDFQELVAGEKVNVSIPLRFQGTPAGVREG